MASSIENEDTVRKRNYLTPIINAQSQQHQEQQQQDQYRSLAKNPQATRLTETLFYGSKSVRFEDNLNEETNETHINNKYAAVTTKGHSSAIGNSKGQNHIATIGQNKSINPVDRESILCMIREKATAVEQKGTDAGYHLCSTNKRNIFAKPLDCGIERQLENLAEIKLKKHIFSDVSQDISTISKHENSSPMNNNIVLSEDGLLRGVSYHSDHSSMASTIKDTHSGNSIASIVTENDCSPTPEVLSPESLMTRTVDDFGVSVHQVGECGGLGKLIHDLAAPMHNIFTILSEKVMINQFLCLFI